MRRSAARESARFHLAREAAQPGDHVVGVGRLRAQEQYDQPPGEERAQDASVDVLLGHGARLPQEVAQTVLLRGLSFPGAGATEVARPCGFSGGVASAWPRCVSRTEPGANEPGR